MESLRDEVAENLRQRLKKYRDGEAEIVPHEEVLEELGLAEK